MKTKVLFTGLFFTLLPAAALPTSSDPIISSIQNIQDDFLDASRAYEMGFLSKMVYSLVTTNQTTFGENIPEEIYETMGWIDKGGTEAWIGRKLSSPGSYSYVPSGGIIVAFRGTEEIADWINNIDQGQVPYGSPNHTLDDTMYQPAPDGSTEELAILAHRGFNRMFRIYNQILDFVTPLLNENRNNLYVTGHSLGGANAQLFSAHFAFDNPLKNVYLTTFGAPRCGNRGFKIFSEQIINLNMFRLVNGNDVVPRVPYDNYDHAGHLVWRQPESNKVTAYFRQIGSKVWNYQGSQDFSMAIFKSETASILIEDHMMSGYMEWFELAMKNPTSNFTLSFERHLK
jgi:hypothetical protein